jgi:hypothetical protein
MRDLPSRYASSLYAPNGTCRVRHTYNQPRQPILRRGSSRIHHIFVVVVVAAPDGARALRTTIFMRHLQHVLDAFWITGSPTDVNSHSIPVVSDKVQRSNVVSISVALRSRYTNVAGAPVYGINANDSYGKVTVGVCSTRKEEL